jgi:hypothetical protein
MLPDVFKVSLRETNNPFIGKPCSVDRTVPATLKSAYGIPYSTGSGPTLQPKNIPSIEQIKILNKFKIPNEVL